MKSIKLTHICVVSKPYVKDNNDVEMEENQEESKNAMHAQQKIIVEFNPSVRITLNGMRSTGWLTINANIAIFCSIYREEEESSK